MKNGWPDKDGNMRYQFRQNGGVNTLNHPIAIANNQMVRCANMFPDASGVLMKRPGLTNIELIDLEIAGGPLAVVYFPLSIFIPNSQLGYKYLKHYFLCGEGLGDDLGERVTLFNADTLHYTDRPSIVTAAVADYASNPLSFVNYLSNTLIIGPRNLTEGFQYWQPNPNGGVRQSTATFVHDPTLNPGSPIAQTQAIPVKPLLACVYQGRMRYFNFGAGRGNWMISADANDDTANPTTNTDEAPFYTNVGSDVLAANGLNFQFDANGETITLAREVMLQMVGSPVQAALLVATREGSCFMCTGDFPETFADPTVLPTFTAQKVNFKCGCVSANTFVKTPYGYIWADANEVWALVYNSPLKIGTLIGKTLADYPPDAMKWWSAAYVDYKYVLQCVSSRGSDDRYLQREQWWLDLTNGLPEHTLSAQWYGPHSVLRDTGDEGGAGLYGKGCFLSGICAESDGSRIIGLSTDSGYLGNTSHGISLVDYSTAFGSDDIPFKTITEGLEWQALTTYNINDVVRPTFYVNVGYIFVCTTGGVSSATEPAGWAFNPANGTLTDGSVVWTELSYTTLFRLLTTNYKNESYLNAMDILTKEFILGRAETDKVLKAVDLMAFAAKLTLFTAELRKNQGAVSSQLSGQNQLTTLFGQDYNAVKAGVSLLDNATISHGQLEGKSLRPLEGFIQRFKSAQLHLLEGTLSNRGPIVIDASNNALVFGFCNDVDICQFFQINFVLSGAKYTTYDNIEALYTDIVALMNTALAGINVVPAGGAPQITLNKPAGPFVYIPPNEGTSTTTVSGYFNGMFCATSAKDLGVGWGLAFGDSNALALNDNNGNTGTFDLLKSKRLMQALGMSTEQTINASNTFGGGALPVEAFWTPTNKAASNTFSSGHLPLFAKSIIPYNATSNIYLAEGVLRARTTSTDPLSFSNR